MTELKPCPFCGGKAHTLKNNAGHYAYCTKCLNGTSYYGTRELAIKAWNTRPDSWHTGVPTEDGDYLVKLDVEHNVYPYYILKWNKGGWYSHYDMDYPACPQHSVLKWQKIEEKI